jgi:hypothetical protein
MIFIPAIYSNFKTLDAIRATIKKAPKQEAGSKEAYELKVFEVCLNYGGPVSCLSEIYEFFGLETVTIETREGKIVLKRDSEGNWNESSTIQFKP